MCSQQRIIPLYCWCVLSVIVLRSTVANAVILTGRASDCQDDLSWHGEDNKLHTCAYIARRHRVRCKRIVGVDGRLANEACPLTCDTCDDNGNTNDTYEDDMNTTPTPTFSPMPTTTPITATTIPPSKRSTLSCDNDDTWNSPTSEEETCQYISLLPRVRCLTVIGAFVYCPGVCDPRCSFSGGSAAPTPTLVCKDDKDWHVVENKDQNCDWVSNASRVRCRSPTLLSVDGKRALKGCPLTCDGRCRPEQVDDDDSGTTLNDLYSQGAWLYNLIAQFGSKPTTLWGQIFFGILNIIFDVEGVVR